MLGRATRPDVPLPADVPAAERRCLIRASRKPHMRVIDVVDNFSRHAEAAAPVTLPSLLALPPAFDMMGASLDGVLRELKARTGMGMYVRERWPLVPLGCWCWTGPTTTHRRRHQSRLITYLPHPHTLKNKNNTNQPLVAEARALQLPCPESLFAARSLEDLRLRVQRFRLLGARALEEEEEEGEDGLVSDMYVLFLIACWGGVCSSLLSPPHSIKY